MRGDWSNLRGVVKGDTMSEVEVEYKVRRWEKPALIGFVSVGCGTSNLKLLVFYVLRVSKSLEDGGNK